MIQYREPGNWIKYNAAAMMEPLAEAKAAILSLKTVPYQKNWVEELQAMQLKREVAGTSRIEGAEFTEKELDAAMRQEPERLHTRSQRQARAAKVAYEWIAELADDRPIDESLIRELHARIVTGADDDHCPPGRLRERDQNVNFGVPQHRGVEGEEECERVFKRYCRAIEREFTEHDPLIQAMAIHYHFAAMHPFLDGNGRTARALEALVLQRAGLRATCFIPMSNYYYDEKPSYLSKLTEVRAQDFDLTPFLVFGLKGMADQCRRLLDEIQLNIRKALFRNLMFDLFNRLRTPRRRMIAKRQLKILDLLLKGPLTWDQMLEETELFYESLKAPGKAIIRDLNELKDLGSIGWNEFEEDDYEFFVRLSWPTEITETEFFEKIKKLPQAKTHNIFKD